MADQLDPNRPWWLVVLALLVPVLGTWISNRDKWIAARRVGASSEKEQAVEAKSTMNAAQLKWIDKQEEKIAKLEARVDELWDELHELQEHADAWRSFAYVLRHQLREARQMAESERRAQPAEAQATRPPFDWTAEPAPPPRHEGIRTPAA